MLCVRYLNNTYMFGINMRRHASAGEQCIEITTIRDFESAQKPSFTDRLMDIITC